VLRHHVGAHVASRRRDSVNVILLLAHVDDCVHPLERVITQFATRGLNVPQAGLKAFEVARRVAHSEQVGLASAASDALDEEAADDVESVSDSDPYLAFIEERDETEEEGAGDAEAAAEGEEAGEQSSETLVDAPLHTVTSTSETAAQVAAQGQNQNTEEAAQDTSEELEVDEMGEAKWQTQ